MMKPILLAGAMMISAPVFAQEAPQQPATSAETQETGQAEAATTADSLDAQAGATTATPDATTTAQDTTATQADPTTTPAQPAQSADAAGAGQPQQASATQIAQIVETEFPTYDGDKDGEITKDEFGKWMLALRSASDPATNAQSAEVQTWVGNAFASADADKSTKVSKAELTTFLAQGAS